MVKCVNCKSSKIRKNGHGRHNSQRFLCRECHKTFSIDGVRGTYSPEFRTAVVDAYCHKKFKAQDVVQDFGVSTRTLIKWKKKHQEHCNCG